MIHTLFAIESYVISCSSKILTERLKTLRTSLILCEDKRRGENKHAANKLLDARRISYLLIKLVCFRARVNAAVMLLVVK